MKGSYGDISLLKPVSTLIFRDAEYPDIAYFVNGLYITKNLEVIDPGRVPQLLFAKSDNIVFKADQSNQGRGILVFDRASFNFNKISNGAFPRIC